MPFPKNIPARHLPAVVELLKGFLKQKQAPKPAVHLTPAQLERLRKPEPLRWREVYHWIDSDKIYAKN